MTKYQVIAIELDGSETLLQIHDKLATANLAIDTFKKLQAYPGVIINYPPLTFKISEIDD